MSRSSLTIHSEETRLIVIDTERQIRPMATEISCFQVRDTVCQRYTLRRLCHGTAAQHWHSLPGLANGQ